MDQMELSTLFQLVFLKSPMLLLFLYRVVKGGVSKGRGFPTNGILRVPQGATPSP